MTTMMTTKIGGAKSRPFSLLVDSKQISEEPTKAEVVKTMAEDLGAFTASSVLFVCACVCMFFFFFFVRLYMRVCGIPLVSNSRRTMDFVSRDPRTRFGEWTEIKCACARPVCFFFFF